MSSISTHVLDVSRGRPAAGVVVTLERRRGEGWRPLARAATDGDGRIAGMLPEGVPLEAGTYRLTFATGAYFQRLEVEGFFPEASITFEIREPAEHHHVPLLLAPHAYSTYRGS